MRNKDNIELRVGQVWKGMDGSFREIVDLSIKTGVGTVHPTEKRCIYRYPCMDFNVFHELKKQGPCDELKERFNEFREQENHLYDELQSLCDRFCEEYMMTRCQVFGVLMDFALVRFDRPSMEEDPDLENEDENEDDSESWRTSHE